jgi:hypothetical protein
MSETGGAEQSEDMVLQLKCLATSDQFYLFAFGTEHNPNYTIFVKKSFDEIRELQDKIYKPLVKDSTEIVVLIFDKDQPSG